MNPPDPTTGELHGQHVNRAMAVMLRLMGSRSEVRSEGSLVYDEEGLDYLDCGGFGVFLLGHRHPGVVGAVERQLARHPMSTHSLFEPEIACAARDLAAIAPGPLDYVFFTNSGAEAVELSLKVALANGRHRLVSTVRGFHGKTLGALSVTGKDDYRAPFAERMMQTQFVPFGSIESLREVVTDDGTTAVILEPVQGEGGVRIPPHGYLREVASLCAERGALLIVDEVQSGLGRTGLLWACERDGVQPDVLLSGKILGGGVLPVGATCVRREWYEPFNRDPLLHTSTFGGNPLAAAAVRAVVGAVTAPGFLEKVRELGDELLAMMTRLWAAHPDLIVDCRGSGLLIGIEFATSTLAADMMTELLSRRVLTSYTLNSREVLRFTPPATLTTAEVSRLEHALTESCAELSERAGRRKETSGAQVRYVR